MRNTMAMVAVSVLVSLMLMGQGCPTPAPDLVVDLGDDQTIDLGWAAFIPSLVTGGTEPYSYVWTQVGGTRAIMTDPTSAGTTVIPDTAGTATFRLTVTDHKGHSGHDEVSVKIIPPPSGSFRVDAGAPQTVDGGEVAQFTAVASNPPDEVTYEWSVVYGLATLVDTDRETVTANAPTTPGDSVIMVKATSAGQTVQDLVFLTVRAPLSVLLETGSKAVELGQVTSLDALAAGGVGPYSFQWVQLSGVLAKTEVVSTTTDSVLSITMLAVGPAVFRVTVTDYRGATASTQGSVTAMPASSQALNVNAGVDQTVSLGDEAKLNGTVRGGTTPYAILWTQIDGAAAEIADPESAATTVIPSSGGQATFRLTATDILGRTASDQMVLTTLASPGSGIVVDAGPDQTLGVADLIVSGSVTGANPPFTYAWTVVSKPEESPDLFFTNFTAPATRVVFLGTAVPGVFVFQLEVTEPYTGRKGSDTVTYTLVP
ncbi:MAG: hypothetical protein GXY44_13735 [Phycisphaerales bacterium]|nr:hypothetical protein [Phycisphaerales bacterium]